MVKEGEEDAGSCNSKSRLWEYDVTACTRRKERPDLEKCGQTSGREDSGVRNDEAD